MLLRDLIFLDWINPIYAWQSRILHVSNKDTVVSSTESREKMYGNCLIKIIVYRPAKFDLDSNSVEVLFSALWRVLVLEPNRGMILYQYSARLTLLHSIYWRYSFIFYQICIISILNLKFSHKTVLMNKKIVRLL